MLQVSLKCGREKRVKCFHPWIYRNDVISTSRNAVPGEICTVRNCNGKFLAKGYINPKSRIIIRILTYNREDKINEGFLKNRIERAIRYRQKVVRDSTAYRLIHSEADLLPGLIVDRYNDYLVLQINTLGMEKLKSSIIKILVKLIKPKGIYEKSTTSARKLEGLESCERTLFGNVPETVSEVENGIRFIVPIKGGQKTGSFLDQRENKLLFAREFVGENSRILDAFCHIGGFGIYGTCVGKAQEAVLVDSSQSALELARENARINDVGDKVKIIKGDAFKVLKSMQVSGETFDSIVIDPPAFAKRKKDVDQAKKGYKELFLRGLKMLRHGGNIVVCSCSYHITLPILEGILLSAANDARVPLRILYTTYQAKDHPAVLQIPETRYLKCIFANSLF